ncbi:hypothetical protein GS501_05340 [Saccharibacter sp. 17.LH.SD]|nr:hypothetical protein [Saccharibacter sp. 17.LH.SD]
MAQPAFLHNPNSRRNQQDGDKSLAFAREKLGEFCISSQHDAHLRGHIASLAERNVDAIAINGGDGTVSACLTAIASVYPEDKLPAIAVLPSGNTNLIAGDVGFGLRGAAAIERLVGGKVFRISERSPIRLSWPEGTRPSILGMFGGCTGYARAVHIAHSPTVLRFAPHDLAVIITVATSLLSLIFPRSRHSWLRGNRLHWQALQKEGMLVRDGQSFFFLVTALEKLSRGIWPFWDEKNNQDGFHFIDVNAFPSRFPAALGNLLRGRAPQWLRQNSDYVSSQTERMRLATDSDFVLDGEVFPALPEATMILERGPVFRFLHA